MRFEATMLQTVHPGMLAEAKLDLLVWVALAVVGLVFLVGRWKLHAFLGIILAAVLVGLGSGMPLSGIAKSFQEGVGSTLGFIAVVVGLGTMLGKLLAESTGAEIVANRLITLFGNRYLPWSLMLVAFFVGLPVFFGVGLVLLIPILKSLSSETKRQLAWLGLPVVAGLSASHGLVPPHPGPMVAIDRFNADIGKTILYAAIIGIPAAALAGPLYLRWISPRLGLDTPVTQSAAIAGNTPVPVPHPPSFTVAAGVTLMPIGLMLLGTFGTVFLAKGDALRITLEFIASPLVAMTATVLLALEFLGRRCGFSKDRLSAILEESVGPAASIFLVVGAGGGFSKVLDASGASAVVGDLAKQASISPLLLGWMVAAAIRIAVGSATVAITLAAAILAPVVQAQPNVNKELLVVAMGAGSLILSHLNDGGFWFVKEYLGLSVSHTLKTWTVIETIISIAALLLVLALAAAVG